jgi:tetratricopeptide (TPR) repeat protein
MAAMKWVAWLIGIVALVAVGSRAVAAPARTDAAEMEARRGLAEIDPALPRLFDEATAAMDAGRLEQASQQFDAIQAAAPKHAATLRRGAFIRSEQGRHDEAIALARKALASGSTPLNEAMLAFVLSAKPNAPAASEEARTHAFRALEGPDDTTTAHVAAKIALEKNDRNLLAEAVAMLERAAPERYETHYLAALLHVTDDDLDAADQAISRAEARGLKPDVAASLRERAQIDRHKAIWKAVRVSLTIAGIWLLGILLIFVLGLLLSRATLGAVERFAADRSDALLARTRTMRRIYKGMSASRRSTTSSRSPSSRR